MDMSLNPYSPGSGLRPRVLGGRMEEIRYFDALVARSKRGLYGRGLVMYGLRGVGKTVLLNYLHDHARHQGWLTVPLEGRGDEDGRTRTRAQLGRQLQAAVRRFEGDKKSRKFAQALDSISSFSVTVGTTGIAASATMEPGRANSGDLGIDLEEVVEDLSEALKEQHSALAIFVDEMQDLDPALLTTLLTVQHRAGQFNLPFFIIGAGLSNLPGVLSEARSYAERLFDYRCIGELEDDEAMRALRRPAEDMGADFDPEALGKLLEASGRYPYFLQVFGSEIWNCAEDKYFDTQDANLAITLGYDQLDSGFFRARWDRATAGERKYLLAMAADGDSGSSTSEVARRLGTTQSGAAPRRQSLIRKGIIYAPDHGRVAFTVPAMAGFIHRLHEAMED